MKLRNGFVSNSSSSSFLIKVDDFFPHTLAVASYMVGKMYDDYIICWNKEHPRKSEINKRLKFLEQYGRENTQIVFKSTNYDTYIQYITDDYIFVDTCNNVEWDLDDKCLHRLPEELGKLDIDFTYEGPSVYETDFYDDDFFHLDYGISITRKKGYKSCNKEKDGHRCHA